MAREDMVGLLSLGGVWPVAGVVSVVAWDL